LLSSTVLATTTTQLKTTGTKPNKPINILNIRTTNTAVIVDETTPQYDDEVPTPVIAVENTEEFKTASTAPETTYPYEVQSSSRAIHTHFPTFIIQPQQPRVVTFALPTIAQLM
jgi:hypothetical protein